MMPNWETHIFNHTISWNILIPGVIIPGIMFNLIALYPAIESWAIKDRGFHNELQRPRDVPVRAALGVMSLTFYMVLVIAGSNDILANTFHWSLQATTWVLRVLLIALPPIAFKLTKRLCLGLQHHDEALLHHGVETGIIRRSPTGEYYEVEEPLPDDKAAILARQIGNDVHGNGHAAAITSGKRPVAPTNGAGSTNGSSGRLRRPLGAAENARRKLEKFMVEPREPVPDPHDAEDTTAHH
jgi:ubiquinol-cytochrome c reductase cytochrome b subunit